MPAALTQKPNNSLSDRLREKYTKKLESFQPDFELRAGLCSTYSCLLKGIYTDEVTVSDVKGIATKSGRVILSGRGASGKTAFLNKLSLSVINSGALAIFINLSKWSPAATQFFEGHANSPLESFEFLLRNFTDERIDIATLDAFPASQQKLIIVDGINETPGKNADRILLACDRATSALPGLACIVSDRLVRRNLANESSWTYLSMLPLNLDDAKKFVDLTTFNVQSKPLLSIPLFLDHAIKDGIETSAKDGIETSAVNTFRQLFFNHGGLDTDEFNALSNKALKIYRELKSRTFPVDSFKEELLNKLISANVISPPVNGEAFFTHHLLHDFLSANAIAQSKDLWSETLRHECFDALTFNANSFDAISFVLQLIPTEQKADFLSAVYDWNPYASGYALADIEANEPDHTFDEIRTIVLAMLALRKYDHQLFTQQKANDALDLFRDDFAKRLTNTSNLDELISIIEETPSGTTAFNQWKILFTKRTHEYASNTDVKLLAESNSILGWTSSNVLKRLNLQSEQVKNILKLTKHESSVVRWRAVHTLGSIEKDKSVNELFKIVRSDNNKYVRFGAMRSLIELAYKNYDLTDSILERVVDQLPHLYSDKIVISELKNAMFVGYDTHYPNWISKVASVFNKLIDLSNTLDELETWTASASKLKLLHRKVFND